MNELIKIHDHKNQKLVDARELHEFLEVQSRFNDWITNRITRFGFAINQDYITFTKNLVNGGRQVEYGLTLDMAKELSMVENNERGKQARKYFIEKEKEALNQYGLVSPSRKQLAQWVLQQEEELEQLRLNNAEKEKQIKTLAPKAELMSKVLETDDLIDIGQVAKILELPFGRNTLFMRLRERGVFFKGKNEPKQEYIQRGYFKLKEKLIERNEHENFVTIKVLVTQRGLEFISKLFNASVSSKEMAKIQVC